MDWQQRMKKALDYLESHLLDEVDYDDAARKANCSPSHFMRMFMVITGVSPAEYVRRRRLSLAAVELAGSAVDVRVLDTALKYGYDSPDSFARSFRREFGVLPSEARQQGITLHLYPPLVFTVSLTGAEAMEYRLEDEPELKLTGYVLHVPCINGENQISIPGFWDTLIADGRCQKLCAAMRKNSRLGEVGVCMNFSAKKDSFDYAVAVETPEDHSVISETTTEFVVPASKYAKFTFRGPLHDVFDASLKRIWTEWFPASGKEHAGTPEIEFYGGMIEGIPSDSRNFWCEYWVPIK